jgi:hypothetical protein
VCCRIEVFLYAMLSAPMIVSFDLATLNSTKQAFAKDLFLNNEIIAVHIDQGERSNICIMCCITSSCSLLISCLSYGGR